MDDERAAWLKAQIAESPDDYSKYLELTELYIRTERFQAAYDCVSRLLNKIPDSIDVLMTSAALAVKLERYEEALSLFGTASRLAPENVDLFHNIGLLNVTLQRPQDAEEAFRKVVSIAPRDADGLNDLAVVLTHQDKVDEAVRVFERAMETNPGHEKSLENYIEFCICENMREEGSSALEKLAALNPDNALIPQWRIALRHLDQLDVSGEESVSATQVEDELCVAGHKIAFFSTQSSFAEGILAHLSQRNEVRRFSGDSVEQMCELMRWADLAWFEWCDQLLIQATKLSKMCKIICRLHSYEAFTQMPAEVDWTKVDRLVLVNQNVADVINQFHDITVDTDIIHNGIDLRKFTIPADKKYGKKICSLGYMNYKKNPGLLLYCFKAIHDYDLGFEFYVAGKHQDPRIKVYFDHMIRRLDLPIHLENWVEDVPAYLRDKDFVISTSLFESFHYSIAEGMASGVLPLIHAWPGAENIYPAEYLFDAPDDCARLLDRLMKSDRKELAAKNRQYISDRFSQKRQIASFERVISSLDCKSEIPNSGKLIPDIVTKSDADLGRVSIIIPTYNRAEYLEEAIESALKQTYSNCEIIVCDDGSTDNTLELLEQYKNEITILRHKTNRGVSAALNTCIRASEGEYISWLSSDDAYLPEKILTEVRYMHESPDVGMVYSDFYYIDKYSNRRQRANVKPLTEGNERLELFRRNPINGCSVMFRKSCLEWTGLFDEELGGRAGYTADGAMWHKMAHFFKIRFIDKPLVFYRVHGDNVADRTDTEKAWSEYREYMTKWFDEKDAIDKQPEGASDRSATTDMQMRR
jgi:tetratricopeptide (TPR) repeat protein